MKIKMIGTGAIGAKQNSASTLIDETILVDCGNGTVKAMLKNDIDINKIQAVLITHFHMDHFLDLPIFLLTRTFKYKEGTLTVYGPKGIEANCKELYDKYMNDGDSFETIKKNTGINFIEVENESLHNLEEYTIESYEVTHGNISDCYGYTLEKNNCKIGFTGDASLCENVLKIIDESYLTIIDMCYLKGNIYHLGCDNIENICRNNPNKKYIPTHMTTMSRNYIMDKKIDNLTILNDCDEYVIGDGVK